MSPGTAARPPAWRGGTIANNSNVLQWHWLNKANQKWTFTKTGDSYYKIKALRSVTS